MSHSPQIAKAYVLIVLGLEFTTRPQALADTRLTEESLAEKETLDLADAVQVVSNINKHSYTPNWAALFGNHLGIATHGPVGYAAVSAPTIGRALVTFIEWFKVRCDCYTGVIAEQDESFEIFITDTSGDETFKAFFFEAVMRAFEVLIGLLTGHAKNRQTTLYFETLAEDRRDLMKEEYDSHLHFGADANKLMVPKSIWYQPSPLSDKDSHALNLRKCQQLLESLEQENRIDIAVRNIVRNSIENRLMCRENTSRLPSLKTVSVALHQSERTLVRKLNQNGGSYKQIVETQRKFFSEKLLQDARYTVADIADILGYTESASFCRAFKGWYGISPSTYRRNPDRL